MEFHGRQGSRLLYVDGVFGVVVDENSNFVLSVDEREALVASAQWDASQGGIRGFSPRTSKSVA